MSFNINFARAVEELLSPGGYLQKASNWGFFHYVRKWFAFQELLFVFQFLDLPLACYLLLYGQILLEVFWRITNAYIQDRFLG